MSKKSPRKKMPPPKATLLLLGVNTKMPKPENPASKPVSRFDDLMRAVVKVKPEKKKKSAERKK